MPDCLVASMEALGRLDEADCDAVPKGVWHDECVFLYAEREARAGNLAEAFAACERTVFGRECSFHLIRIGARTVLDRPMTEAAAIAVAYQGLPRAADAQRLFWKTWFRERMEKDEPVDPMGCPTEDCVEGARQTVLLTLNALARAGGDSFCDGSVPDGRSGKRTLWVAGPETVGWVDEFVEGECARRRGQVRGPGGPRPGATPGATPGAATGARQVPPG